MTGLSMETIVGLLVVAVVLLVALVLMIGVSALRGGSGQRLPTTAERVEQLEDRMARMEATLEKLPTSDALHQVSLQIAKVDGVAKATSEKLERMGDKIEGATSALERVESYLMVAATDAIMKTRPERAARTPRKADEGTP